MPLQTSDAVANAQLDAIETTIGASAILELRTGPPPANVAAAATGTVLATLNLPADWMSAASARSKALLGTWQDTAADATGRGEPLAIKASGGTYHLQGLAAGPWKAATNYAVGDHVLNDSGKVYRATTAGVSASSGGPAGTGGTIVDGAAAWTYVEAAAGGGTIVLDNGDIAAAQALSITGFTLTAPNA